MTIELAYHLNKENDNKYTYLENGFIAVSAKNLSKNTINVFEVFIQFKNNNVTKNSFKNAMSE